jgi:hypothetical protein
VGSLAVLLRTIDSDGMRSWSFADAWRRAGQWWSRRGSRRPPIVVSGAMFCMLAWRAVAHMREMESGVVIAIPFWAGKTMVPAYRREGDCGARSVGIGVGVAVGAVMYLPLNVDLVNSIGPLSGQPPLSTALQS